MAGEKRSSEQAGVTPASELINERPRSIPIVQDCDVCVLGGGCTGVFAAVRAAQMGARVALIEKQNAFGGGPQKLDNVISSKSARKERS